MKKVGKERINWPVTILLIAGLITVVFHCIWLLSLRWRNLRKWRMMSQESYRFQSISVWVILQRRWKWQISGNSLGNSLLITVVTVVLAMLIHSLLGYAIARNKAHSKFYKFIYFYVVSGMFVPFAILMMPVVKQTAQMGLANRAGVIILYLVFYMPMNVLLYSGYLTNIPRALERGSMRGWSKYMDNLLEDHLSDHEADACHSGSSDSTWNLEWCYDSTGYHVRIYGWNHIAPGTAEFPDSVRNKL